VDLYLDSLGETRGRQALQAGDAPATAYVRLNPFAAQPEVTIEVLRSMGAGPVPEPIDLDCFRLEEPAALYRAAGVAGAFAMDAAAQVAPAVCAVSPGESVLDIGAGRGNKTICLQATAVRRGGTASIVALDVHPGKTAALAARTIDEGVPDVCAVVGDATQLPAAVGDAVFDCVLLDAPCSGTGTLRRYPEKRWRLTPEDPARMSELQVELLAAAARVVRPGGRVVYSTCSIAPVENSGVVERFLDSTAGAFYLESLKPAIPSEWNEFVTEAGTFQSYPREGGPDGHFVSVLRRSAV
jgi:16S rRNA (cytosine967-C5)-methyltransferase